MFYYPARCVTLGGGVLGGGHETRLVVLEMQGRERRERKKSLYSFIPHVLTRSDLVSKIGTVTYSMLTTSTSYQIPRQVKYEESSKKRRKKQRKRKKKKKKERKKRIIIKRIIIRRIIIRRIRRIRRKGKRKVVILLAKLAKSPGS
jgi:hypothetical protein